MLKLLIGTTFLAGIAVWQFGWPSGAMSRSEPGPAAVSAQPLVTPPIILRLAINIDPQTAYGSVWDGLGASGLVGPMIVNFGLSSQPDPVACISTLRSTYCTEVQRDGAPGSLFHDSLTAEWDLEVQPAEPFAIILFDLDTSQWDLRIAGGDDFIDAIIVAPRETPEDALRKLDDRMRAYIEKRSPTAVGRPDFLPPGPPIRIAPGERSRRERPMNIVTLDQITAERGIRLVQSTINARTLP